MKALVLEAPGKFKMRQMERPSPRRSEALIRVKVVGLCRSDVHAYRGSHPFISYPRILGHEVVGETVKVNKKNDKNLQVGDLVVIDPVLNCGLCYPCRIGRPNCCINVKTPGIHFHGGMCEYISLPVRLLHKVPPSADPSVFTLTEPLSVAIQAINRGKVSKEDSVAILGAGPIGLSCLMVSKICKAKVIIIDLLESRLEIAARLGANRIVNVREEDSLTAVRDFTHNEGANVTIEAVGSPKTVQGAVQMVSAGGRIVLVGLSPKTVGLRISDIIEKELDIAASRLNNGLFPKAIQLIARGKANVGSLITHEFDLGETEKAIKLMEEHPEEVMKIVLRV